MTERKLQEIQEKLEKVPCSACGNPSDLCTCAPEEKQRRDRLKQQMLRHLVNMDVEEREALEKRMKERKKQNEA